MNNTSFRDPSGFVYKTKDILYRQINLSYKDNYDFLIKSGLYKTLTDKKYLVSHEEIEAENKSDSNCYRTIKPEIIDFISYPYEWCFSQIKDAALLTLKIQKISLKFGMSLKDASAYNVQFMDGKPIFIDTLSFEKYKANTPWVAYKQFCQHFLAPLALMGYSDISLNQLLKANIDGIPLDLACKLLPLKVKFNFGIFMHLFLHSASQKKYENRNDSEKITHASISLNNHLALIDSLIDTIKGLKLNNIKTEWGDYYNNTNYTDKAFLAKKALILEYIDIISPKKIWDLGANEGEFSRIAASKDCNVISLDIDPIAVEKNYLTIKKHKEKNILPLLQDLTNPSPCIGFANDERNSLMKRINCDLAMALALIHHLAISNNIPLVNLAEFFSKMSPHLIIEFVPKEDSKVQTLLATREDIFDNYTQDGFESAFGQYFEIIRKDNVANSKRNLYLMRFKQNG